MAALLLCPAAFADTFNFTYSGVGTIGSTTTNFTGSGTFTATPTATAGQYLINSVSGTANGVSIAGLLAPGIYPSTSSGNEPNDNFLFFPLANGGALDLNGFSFNTTDGTDYNVYYFPATLATGYGLATDPDFDGTTNLTFDLTDATTGTPVVGTPGGPTTAATPEPGSLALLATGFFGIAGVVRRRLA
ncbi:MAG TPA: PEP-CTERM sorting domain-containing protein [Bryocella sp.]|nr:PEP-CTERM sorting domain-containing protein [Bryocella sp.]